MSAASDSTHAPDRVQRATASRAAPPRQLHDQRRHLLFILVVFLLFVFPFGLLGAFVFSDSVSIIAIDYRIGLNLRLELPLSVLLPAWVVPRLCAQRDDAAATTARSPDLTNKHLLIICEPTASLPLFAGESGWNRAPRLLSVEIESRGAPIAGNSRSNRRPDFFFILGTELLLLAFVLLLV